MKGKYRFSLVKKIVIMFCVLSLLLISTVSAAMSYRFWESKKEEYSKIAYSYAETAAKIINGDTVLDYAHNNKKDQYYDNVLKYLNLVQKYSSILYYYVFVPYDDHIVYVWDADNYEGACEQGQKEEYIQGGKKASEDAMNDKLSTSMKMTKSDKYGYIGSVYYSIKNSKGESVALVGVDISMSDIKQQFYSYITVIIGVIITIVTIFMIMFYMIVRKGIVNPLNKLNKYTNSMVKNIDKKKDVVIRINTGDEIEELAGSFEQMVVEVRDYITKLSEITKEKERIKADLDVATRIQTSMLPCIFPAFPERDEFEIFATMDPAKEVGGDFYDFYMIDDDHIAITIADVSGKGVPAALFMAISKAVLHSNALLGMSPKEIIETTNKSLCKNNMASMFVTVWLGILEISTGKITAVNAGHEYPVIMKAGGNYEYLKDKHGMMVGAMDFAVYKEYEIQLEPGDRLFLYTDGVPEATNAENEMYGMERELEILNRCKNDTPTETLSHIRADVDAFVKEAPQFDDLTMLILYYNGDTNNNERC